MPSAKMVMEIEHMRFEKYPSSNTINIYVGNKEVDCYTNYEIGSDFEKFEDSCQGHYDYAMSQN
jgi:hypothetical protein